MCLTFFFFIFVVEQGESVGLTPNLFDLNKYIFSLFLKINIIFIL